VLPNALQMQFMLPANDVPAVVEQLTLSRAGAGNFTLFGFVETMCEGGYSSAWQRTMDLSQQLEPG
jgi:hypothetical protein